MWSGSWWSRALFLVFEELKTWKMVPHESYLGDFRQLPWECCTLAMS